MTLTFLTKSQQMTLVDALPPHQVVSASSLQPNHPYNVFVVIQNDGNYEELNVQCSVSHSPFGIGLPGSTTNLTQPASVNVPPKGPGGNGCATVMFGYVTPPGGHTCLYATIQPSGPSISQNTDVYASPIGIPATFSFLVFGGHAAEVMKLTVAERLGSGAPVSPADSWKPKLAAPPGTGPATPVAAPVNLNLDADCYYSVGLIITPAGSEPHIFHVTGYLGTTDVGEVDITVQPSPSTPVPACDPYINGGYQSADVILIDPATGNPVPLGGLPGGRWDTTLKPDTDYGFAACVHNSSTTDAVNTVVRFWGFMGGVGSAGIFIDIQTATVPALSSVIVSAAHPFRSAPAGRHRCAVVSISNSRAAVCNHDAVTSSQVPSPVINSAHSCSAWRNTDSMFVIPKIPWEIILAVNAPHLQGPDPGPVEVDLFTFHVPENWNTIKRVVETAKVLGEAAAPRETPLYLMPSLRDTLNPVDLKIAVKTDQGSGKGILSEMKVQPRKLAGGVELTPAKTFRIDLKQNREVPFTISGTIPAGVKPGEQILVQVIAHYGKTERSPARDIEFVEILHVRKE
jgi:hypothetical protein